MRRQPENSGDEQYFTRIGACDLDGVLRGKIISSQKLENALSEGLGFCNVIFGWDVEDHCYDEVSYSGWNSGYPDARLHLDLKSERQLAWVKNQRFLLGDFREDPEASNICPRTLLSNITDQAEDMGFSPIFAQEFEWFNFRQEGITPQPISKGMFGYSLLRLSERDDLVSDLLGHLQEARINIEGLHTETGPGVWELALKKDHIREAADQAFLCKEWVKEIAKQHGITSSFMAKWNPDLPGCSGHVHQSLQDSDGKNLFFEDGSPHQLSQIGQQYLAGILRCLPEILPLFAPTVNSYKRLTEGTWAPVNVSWGEENRTAAIRLISHSADQCRLENRVVGSDANPYLAQAASLAAGLYGISHQLELNQSPVRGNAYTDKNLERLPANLQEATGRMEHSSIAIELFGEKFVKHFVDSRKWEWRQYEKAVTDWELKRYFEII